VSNSGSGGGI